MSKNKEVDYSEWTDVWVDWMKHYHDNLKGTEESGDYIGEGVYSGLLKCFIDPKTGKPMKEEK
jgi:hypothetical protein